MPERGWRRRAYRKTTMTHDSLISLAGLGKVFFADAVETHALENIDLSVATGEFVSVAGPSGCGKTTLLSILGLLDSHSSGRYLLDGKPVENLTAGQRARVRNEVIGFIFQSFHLIGGLTVYENVELPLTYRSKRAAERRERVLESLDRVGLAHRKRHYPNQLSGGQQQRVAVARAIVGRPLILLADEPTGNLDSKNGATVMALLQELHEDGATICIVTHDPRYAHMAERTVHLFDGHIVSDDRVQRHSLERAGIDLA